MIDHGTDPDLDPARLDLRSVTPTICAVLGAVPPALCDAEPFPETAGVRVERVLVYAPDVIGTALVERHREEFESVRRHAPVEMRLHSMMPTMTPVCFASMFTGAMPVSHGVRKYEKRVLACDTLFDALARAGRRSAIAAVADNSIDILFASREADRFSEPYDREVLDRTLDLLAKDEHDLILCYHQEYDDTLHRTTPESPEALQAMRNHVAAFDRLAGAAKDAWGDRPGLILFTPDHGAHVNPETGRGAHGTDRPDDLEVTHFLGIAGSHRG